MYFYLPSLASNFRVWRSFQSGSLKIHLVFIERVSVGDGTIETQRKIGQGRRGKEHVEKEMQTGTRKDETAQSSKPKTLMLAAFSAGAIWICALQPLPSKPQQEGGTLSSAPWLLHTLPASLSSAGITLQTHFPYAARFWSICWALTGPRVNGMKGICDQHAARLSRAFSLPPAPSSAHPAVFGRHSIALIEHVLADRFGKHIKNSWKGRCCLFVLQIH